MLSAPDTRTVIKTVHQMNIRSLLQAQINRSEALFSLKQELDLLPAVLGRRNGANRSWSQHGEDDFLSREVAGFLKSGYYVDVGANHPTKLSNTFKLYCMGMRGISVEPSPTLSRLHSRYRPEDIQLSGGVGANDGLLPFYRLSCHVLSTFSREECERAVTNGHRMLSRSLVPVFTLRTILDSCPFKDRPHFALLSVDTEGLDAMVLRSNDWTKYRPRLIVVENNGQNSVVRDYLGGLGYRLVASRACNDIFKTVE
jgi:FkbM family methyltransferase